MRPKKMTIRFAAVTAFALACVMGLAACSSIGGSGKVAATVNGSKIMEDDVTAYITDFRASNGLEDDEAWNAWMDESSMTPSVVREQVIDYFVDQEIAKQAAKEKGVTVSKSDVDEQVETMKANYDSEESWKDALAAAGTNEESYRESVENAILQSKLQEALNEEAEAGISDEKLVEGLNTYASTYDGAKRSSHILFASDDEATAKDVLAKINSGELDFADAAKKHSTDTGSAEKGGDVGWDKLSSFVPEYQDALSGLEKDQVSELVASDYGIHIIKCTDVFAAPEEITAVDQVPSEFADAVREMLKSSESAASYSNYISDFKKEAEIEIKEMPEGLPYVVGEYAAIEKANSNKESTVKGADDDEAAKESAEQDSADKGAESEKDAE